MDLDKLETWAERWQMRFNNDKCKVIHMGRRNQYHYYTLNGKPLGKSDREKDLGILVNDKFTWSSQCQAAVAKANRIMGAEERISGGCRAESERISAGGCRAESERISAGGCRAESERISAGGCRAEGERISAEDAGLRVRGSVLEDAGLRVRGSVLEDAGLEVREISAGGCRAESERISAGGGRAEGERISAGGCRAESERISAGGCRAERVLRSERISAGGGRAEGNEEGYKMQKAVNFHLLVVRLVDLATESRLHFLNHLDESRNRRLIDELLESYKATVICIICQTKLRRDKNTANLSTTSMQKHMAAKHPIEDDHEFRVRRQLEETDESNLGPE
ncbi:unnamed protein product, partial [Ranitomeya imitator]